jgi:predicted DNA-binding transcriptional regulator AlpA
VTHRLVKAQELEVKTIAWVEDEGLDWIGKRIEERDKV